MKLINSPTLLLFTFRVELIANNIQNKVTSEFSKELLSISSNNLSIDISSQRNPIQSQNLAQKQLLNKVIFLNSEEIKGKNYENQRIVTENGELHVRDCKFFKCSNDDGKGGAIYSKVKGTIEFSLFDLCSAKEGGCMYTEADIIWESNIVCRIKVATRNGGIGFNQGSFNLQVRFSSFTQISSSDFCIFAKYYGSKNKIQRTNSSKNTPVAVSSAFELGLAPVLVSYCTIEGYSGFAKNAGCGFYRAQFTLEFSNFLDLTSTFNTEQGVAVWVDGDNSDGEIRRCNFQKIVSYSNAATIYINDGKVKISECCFDTSQTISMKGKFTLGKGNSFSDVCIGQKSLFRQIGIENFIKIFIFLFIAFKIAKFYIKKLLLRKRLMEMRSRKSKYTL
ncbi:hypothetical protein TVAG_019230 [Trichomonas vaginalis G3]|uniref:Right handed beta helix domain-containing protein n=1 Tax=Trichomonas vaginalis (strain ATCC PRA-98 / G3) TaxID=412133 RepID=A2DWZ6_TRIV3|nr:hypothetical protein TVAGG3_0184840 [Trichomonas vaginalis G3]EAY15023.1 hypothetical protein TVAG_019230 [Trichomonas vaginalis G3]KAI5549564.1 hypothetical protein TVAGG3_0184840 [Trichomonas vaginalis G3]|eukprot:XP_001327246.1 hypothetical protein [Trichomonas vaginalis G3]